MWQPGWEGSLGENGYMHTYGWVPSLFTWNSHNIVNWLYLNTELKVQKNKIKFKRDLKKKGMKIPGRSWVVVLLHPWVSPEREGDKVSLCNPMDYTVHGILKARILEWVAFPFSGGSSQTWDQTQVFHISGRFFTSWTTGKPQISPGPAQMPRASRVVFFYKDAAFQDPISWVKRYSFEALLWQINTTDYA